MDNLELYNCDDLKFSRRVSEVYLELKYFNTIPATTFKGKAKVINSNPDNITLRPIGTGTYNLITLDFWECETKEAVVETPSMKIALFKIKKKQ